MPQLTATTQHGHICPRIIPRVNGHVGQVTGGLVSMHRCQTRLKSDGWIDKGRMHTYTQPDRLTALHSPLRQAEVIQCRDDSGPTVGRLVRREWWCISPWALLLTRKNTSEGSDVSLNDKGIMIYWSLRQRSLTQWKTFTCGTFLV